LNQSPEEYLRRYFRFSEFRGCQEAVIAHTMANKHSLVMMPTGGGKSLCFQIPALMLADAAAPCDSKPLTLVLSPLIALMKDQVDSLQSRGIEATFINSSLTSEQRRRRYEQVASGSFSLLYVTPERFRKADFLSVIAMRNVRLLAVDEAHCISEWGHDFRPDYTKLAEFRELLGNPTTMALTATATPDVQTDIVKQLGLEPADCRLFHTGIGRPNLELLVEEVWGREEKLTKIQEQMRRSSVQGTENVESGIVYFSLIRTLEEVSEQLRGLGVEHLCYHGDLSRSDRRWVQDAFMNNQVAWVLATNAFGMGIDKEDIRYVLHAEVPGSIESYYQEIGRAGRDGMPSLCVLLYDQSDLEIQAEFLRWSNPDADYYQRLYDLLVLDQMKVRAFGIDWLREKLSGKNRRDRRLETALGMLQRFGIIDDENDLANVAVQGELPEYLANAELRLGKLLRDQKKLYAMVEYVRSNGHFRPFIEDYFGINATGGIPDATQDSESFS
jgi:ATP-dependent DNA helicase RecQ